MPKISTKIPFEPGKIYHLFNKGNNNEKLFYTQGNYHCFLNLYESYLCPLVHTYAYCLIRNHFHFLIKIKENVSFKEFNREIRRIFVTYAMRVNYQTGRCGTLFTRPVNRIDVNDINYLKYLIFYIHNNPVKHKIEKSIFDYPYSSLPHFLSPKKSIISKNEVLEWFNNDIDEFIKYHFLLQENLTGKDYLTNDFDSVT